MQCRQVAIQKMRNQGRIFSSLTFRSVIRAGLSGVFLMTGLQGCQKPAPDPGPVTITLLDPGLLDPEFTTWRKHEEEEFTHETGIRVKDLPAPETAVDQLALWRKLLQNPSNAPDVFAIDVIWPALTAEYSLNLNAYRSDTAQDFPALVANDVVNGQLVAMPYHVNVGMLFYRTDLLRAYGYRAPPSTWDELEKMAARIQAGERAKGKKDFWGYVWQGAASEALTCNALEWQVSEGGGRIIEDDRTISINNPNAIRSWERAAHWIGSISPPGVVAYKEWDAINLWRSGNAAFMRNWPTYYLASQNEGSVIRGKFAATLLPGGRGGRVGTFGGGSFSVFRNSRHPAQAIALVRYLCRRDVELARMRETFQPPVIPELYDAPEVLKTGPHFAELKQLLLEDTVARPSTVTGAKYGQVSEAYFNGVHSVLTKEKTAAQAASDLEQQLALITGFPVRRISNREHDRSASLTKRLEKRGN